jgi:hypothetical protein
MLGLMIGLRYLLLLLIVPAYFFALSHRRRATIPLWVISTSVMLTQFLMSAQQRTMVADGVQLSTFVFVGEMTKIMLIPIAVQLAVMWKSLKIGVGNQASRSPQRLVEALDAGER